MNVKGQDVGGANDAGAGTWVDFEAAVLLVTCGVAALDALAEVDVAGAAELAAVAVAAGLVLGSAVVWWK